MDPDDAMRVIRRYSERINNAPEDTSPVQLAAWGMTLADHIEALDEWLTKGGFFPAEWMRERRS